jgi:hypothetical protein
MKKSVMTKWVNALRSGKYKRGKGKLRKVVGGVDRHCCLGVLCDISPKASKKWVWDEEYKSWSFTDGETESLPVDVAEWAGMESDLGELSDEYDRNLAAINDSGKYNFNQIADIIEKHWERL